MSARDDYPWMARDRHAFLADECVAALDEIDRLRAIELYVSRYSPVISRAANAHQPRGDEYTPNDPGPIKPQTIDEAQLCMVHQLHRAVYGDTWARPQSPAEGVGHAPRRCPHHVRCEVPTVPSRLHGDRSIHKPIARRTPQMRKFLTPLLAIPVGILALAGTASAHTPNVTASCSGLSITLSLYEGKADNNLVIVGIDNQPPGGVFFAGSYSHTFAWSQTVDHSWSVQIDADRNSGPPTQYDAVFSGVQKACQPAPSTTTPATTVPPTTSTAPATTVPPSTTVVGNTTPVVPAPTTVVTACVEGSVLSDGACVAVGIPPTIAPTPLPTVPVELGIASRTLPRTGERGDIAFAAGLALIAGAVALTIARRRRAA